MNKELYGTETESWRRLWNGVTNYSYGIYHQIDNVNMLILNSENNCKTDQKKLLILLELKKYLESIAKAGNIPHYK
ncbi:hypothetical protein I7V28_22630 [Lelliottia amnigena]|jgi:hypothetical protein|uniref:hypothetical protein n=1 Tax=Lelliottia TaxID=1330545 RepID=UPI00192B7F07|nr:MULTISPECIES: hypothetical protein [Lelliottia]EKD5635442.1 hypothetical protein [Escherichia coli]MBL5884882.1 hypothetical protein [Lelliottia aquatilis]MBL5923869.1 hypothetical protein [Lelliottia amnigena]MBL5932714.1 hypothetical protein [Lelliottia amnigena]